MAGEEEAPGTERQTVPDAAVPEENAAGDPGVERPNVTYVVGKAILRMENGEDFVYVDEDDPLIDYDEFDKITLAPESWNSILDIAKTLQLDNMTDGVLRGLRHLSKQSSYTEGDVIRDFILTHCVPSWKTAEIGTALVVPAAVYDILTVFSFPGYKPFAAAAEVLRTVEEKRAMGMNAFIAWSVAELAIGNANLQMLMSEKIQNAYSAVAKGHAPDGYTILTGSAGTEMSVAVSDVKQASMKVITAHASMKMWMYTVLLKNKDWTTTAIERLRPFICQVLKVSAKGGIVPMGRQISDLRTANFLPLELEDACTEDPDDPTCLRFLGSTDLPKSPLMNTFSPDQISLLNGVTACLKDKNFDKRKPQTVMFIKSKIPSLQGRKRTTRSSLT